eukprot:g7369.t1
MVIAETVVVVGEEIESHAVSPASTTTDSDSNTVSWKIKPMVHYWEKRMRQIHQEAAATVNCTKTGSGKFQKRVPQRERSNKSISEIMDLLSSQEAAQSRPADRRQAILSSCLSLNRVEDIVDKLEKQSNSKH